MIQHLAAKPQGSLSIRWDSWQFATRALLLAIIGSTFQVSADSVPGVPLGRPIQQGMDPKVLGKIDGLVHAAIADRSIPGCVVLITRRGKQIFHRAYGHRQLVPEPIAMQTDTVFDMASITKPVATATSIMLLVEQGKIRLHDAFGLHVDEFNQNGKDEITVFQLLTHQAGFVADSPLSEYDKPKQIWPNLFRLGLTYPPTTRFVYSDVGFQMLGRLVKERSGQRLDAFARENIYLPLGMLETDFLPNESLRARSATTEQREGQWMQGEVHDPRAAAMGGIAGHAGLFSTAPDLARYAQMILNRGEYEGVRVLSEATVARMTRAVDVAGDTRALGWDVNSRYSTNRGDLLSPQAVGHGGFTGTAMWIDPKLELAVIFLSNRVHPDGKGHANRLAGAIANVAAAAIRPNVIGPNVIGPNVIGPNVIGPNVIGPEHQHSDRVTPRPRRLNRELGATQRTPEMVARKDIVQEVIVRTGFDVAAADQFRVFAGKRIGLITNHTGTSGDGRRNIDLLHASDAVQLIAIFSPEHGLEGTKDQSQIVDGFDQATRLPIYSLYGENRKPTPESLAELDMLVFDIQDIGTRFYTYISTMLGAMQTAAAHNKAFVVLDRPNPLGGQIVSGPMLDPGRESFVGCHSLPIQHGMTTGELAKMFVAELGLNLDLSVVPAEGWRRWMRWDETGLVWTNPSPNMRTWNEALLYPGIGLLETTNLSVGRGTDRPFEIMGAPYIQERPFAARLNQLRLPGLRFIPRRFVPTSSKFKGESCGGVDIVITDRDAVRAVEAGLQIAHVLRSAYGDDWKFAGIDRLLCNDMMLKLIEASGTPPSRLVEASQFGSGDYMQRRIKYLIYD